MQKSLGLIETQGLLGGVTAADAAASRLSFQPSRPYAFTRRPSDCSSDASSA